MAKSWQSLTFAVPIVESMRDEKTGDFLIRGKAINATTTRNKTRFLAEELQQSAASLRDKPLLKDHNNSVDSVVGRTTQNVTYDMTEEAVMFEARVMDEAMQKKIETGLVRNVSIGAMLKDLEAVKDENGDVEAFVARGIDFVELSLVAVPADPNAGFTKACMESYKLKLKEGAYTCTECTISFNTKAALATHMSDTHDDDETEKSHKVHTHSLNEEAASMVEDKKTIDALREERAKLEMEIESMKLEALTAEKATLDAAQLLASEKKIENKTVGTIATEQDLDLSFGGKYTYEITGGKLAMSMNPTTMAGTPLDSSREAKMHARQIALNMGARRDA